ncbi:ParB-like nuclease domain protein [Arthrobacter phage NathanVaag]|nr:ParB-like nuclease domain protein [Arthrobacter phage NathanVaag]
MSAEIMTAAQLSEREPGAGSLMPIPQHKLSIEYVSKDAISLYPGNARRGDIDRIAKSIRINGFYQPIVVQRSTGYIIVGNHRYRAATEECGMLELPVSYVDITDAAALKIALADNKTGDEADYDSDALILLFEALGDDIEGSGWEQSEIDAITEALDEATPEPEEEEGPGVVMVTDCPNCGHTFEPQTRMED